MVIAEPDAITGSWYPNLRAGVIPTGPDQLWVADLMYLRIGADAAFLAVMLDVWSRKVVGYALGPVLDSRRPLMRRWTRAARRLGVCTPRTADRTTLHGAIVSVWPRRDCWG